MPAVIRWSPARELVRLSDAMDRMLDDTWTRPFTRTEREVRLPLDVYTTPSEIVLSANVPGLKSDEVEVTLEGDTLTIRGEFKAPMENVDYIFQERPYGKFSRTLTINVPVDNEKVEASFENGVLTITLPKAEAARPKTIKVEAK
jgi:HSP20 family protein